MGDFGTFVLMLVVTSGLGYRSVQLDCLAERGQLENISRANKLAGMFQICMVLTVATSIKMCYSHIADTVLMAVAMSALVAVEIFSLWFYAIRGVVLDYEP